MATITHRPLVRHLQSSSTTYVRRKRNGKVVDAGAGQAFWFRPRTSSISELPLDEREVLLTFRDRTSDFTIDNSHGTWTATSPYIWPDSDDGAHPHVSTQVWCWEV
jgi:hypothetical protein